MLRCIKDVNSSCFAGSSLNTLCEVINQEKELQIHCLLYYYNEEWIKNVLKGSGAGFRGPG
jgi:hypothetical protein